MFMICKKVKVITVNYSNAINTINVGTQELHLTLNFMTYNLT